MEHTVEIPVPFEGSTDEKRMNYQTHDWYVHVESFDEVTVECTKCGSRSYHVAATYQCGVEPPRKTVTISTEGLC